MPFPILHAYARAQPMIEARESLRRASEMAVGSGSLKPQQSRRIVREWQDAARGSSGSWMLRPEDAGQMRATLSTAGISMIDGS